MSADSVWETCHDPRTYKGVFLGAFFGEEGMRELWSGVPADVALVREYQMIDIKRDKELKRDLAKIEAMRYKPRSFIGCLLAFVHHKW